VYGSRDMALLIQLCVCVKPYIRVKMSPQRYLLTLYTAISETLVVIFIYFFVLFWKTAYKSDVFWKFRKFSVIGRVRIHSLHCLKLIMSMESPHKT